MQRHDLSDRITTALDDYVQRSKDSSSKDGEAVGWGVPREGM
jgi:hypothetical protein